MRPISLAFALAAATALAGCGKDAPPTTPGGPAAAPSPYLLAADPGDALDVKKAVAGGPKEGEVVVVGRVKDITKGFAAFTIVDDSLKFCGRGDASDDHCLEPWDYCCVIDELPGAVLAVQVRAGTDVVAMDRIPELRNLDLVAIRGRLVKEKDADLTLVASGWYRRDRPNVPASVKFP